MNNQLGGNIIVVDLKKKFNNCIVCDNFSNILNLNEKKNTILCEYFSGDESGEEEDSLSQARC